MWKVLTMSDTLVIIQNRADEFYIFDPDEIPRTVDLSPVMLLAAAVISAGYAAASGKKGG